MATKKEQRKQKRADKKAAKSNGNPGNPGTAKKKPLKNTLAKVKKFTQNIGKKKQAPTPAQITAVEKLTENNPVLKEVLIEKAGRAETSDQLAHVMNNMPPAEREQLVIDTKMQSSEQLKEIAQQNANSGGGFGGFMDKVGDVIGKSGKVYKAIAGKEDKEEETGGGNNATTDTEKEKEKEKKQRTYLIIGGAVVLLLIVAAVLLRKKTTIV